MARPATPKANTARMSDVTANPLSALDTVPAVGAVETDCGAVVPVETLPGAVSTNVGAGCAGLGAALVGTWIQLTTVPSLYNWTALNVSS